VERSRLIKQHPRLPDRGHVQTNPVLKRQSKARLALLEPQIAELDAEIVRLIAEDQPIGASARFSAPSPAGGRSRQR